MACVSLVRITLRPAPRCPGRTAIKAARRKETYSQVSVNGWLDKQHVVSLCTYYSYSAVKEGRQTPATVWMNLENTAQRKKPDTAGPILYGPIYRKCPE